MNFIAKIDLDGLFPLIIGLIWVIAQVAGAAAKKKNAAPRPAPMRTDDNDSVEDPLADLMRKLGAGQEFKIPTPPKPQEIQVERPLNTDDIEALPDVKPIQRKEVIPLPESIQVPPQDAHPTMSSFKSAMPAIKIPAMKLSLQASKKSGSGISKVGKIINPSDKQTLRRAILGQIILGKPKALENWNTGIAE
jgi:hypothetical protein